MRVAGDSFAFCGPTELTCCEEPWPAVEAVSVLVLVPFVTAES